MEIFKKMSSQRVFYIAAFSFMFVASFSLSLEKIAKSRFTEPPPAVVYEAPKNFPPIPLLMGVGDAPDFNARSILAKDLESGVILYSKNPNQRLFPASTTKMLTAMTALDYYELDEIIKVQNINVEGQKMRLYEGEEISVRDLIQGLLIYSANDAAEALASNFCTSEFETLDMNLEATPDKCGREFFIEAMNSKAQHLHLENTNFTNPTGLDSEDHLTTAHDLAIIAAEAMKNPVIKEVVGTKNATVASTDGKTRHKLTNLNELIGKVEGVLGIKTGWTENAGENLVTFVERDSRRVVIVVLGSEDRFGETTSLIDWIFANYEWKTVNF